MQSYWTRRYWLASCIFVLLFAAGCFQPAGANLEATSSAQAMPTFTPFPTDTPPPTNTPEPTATEEIRTGFATLEGIMPIASDTLDPQALLQGTSIAALPEQQSDIDDLIATATAMAQGQQPLQPQQAQPTATQDIDPLALTATMIVASATAAAGGQQPEATVAPGVTATVAGTTPTATAAPTGSCVHTVVAGQNLFRISLQYNTTVDALAAANGIVNPNMIFVGQQITIPGCGTTTPPTGGTPVPGSGTIHTVVQGETLFEISLQYGVTVHDLAALNGISNINLILIGQQIRIP